MIPVDAGPWTRHQVQSQNHKSRRQIKGKLSLHIDRNVESQTGARNFWHGFCPATAVDLLHRRLGNAPLHRDEIGILGAPIESVSDVDGNDNR